MSKKKEIGVQETTNVETKRVFGLIWRPIMIYRPVAELVHKFRVKKCFMGSTSPYRRNFRHNRRKQSHVEKLSLILTHVDDKPDSKVSNSGVDNASHELVALTTRLPPPLRGCGSPVVKVSNHGRHVMSSIPVPLKTRRVGQRCTLNLSRAETSSRWCGVVVRRGCQLRRHLTMVQNYVVRRQKPSCS
ncbi:uncharacterized protein TNCV_3035551 [Trichonephila clavipes]|nr:uncharacterized protein TNCV_3035551 [Trichonephila clavipes]